MKAESMKAESYIKLRNLTVREGEPVKQIIERGLEQLRGLNEKATLQLRVTGVPGEKRTEAYSIVVTPSGAHLETQFTKPTLAVILPHDSFVRIANGSYSPLQAYLDGNLRLIGNVEVGKRIISHLAGSGTQAGVCPTLYNESWQLDGPGYGHITFSGEFFTDFGTVEIVYNWGGGFYQQIVVADQSGSFTTTQNNLSCGDIPGNPGVGVIVTATDLATGLYVTQGYPTPC
jgi:hypothetical protein